MTQATPEIPGYRIERTLGKGAMGTVYLARHLSLDRYVALKLLKLMEDDARSPELATRFQREGKALARLNHPNIVVPYNVGVSPAGYYITMEYAAGGTLAERILQGISAHDALVMLKSLADALSYVHKAGMVHRDIKPRNLLFRDTGELLLADFGVTKLLDETTITKAGARMGSPAYMSPEQVRGKTADARSDLYSVGIVFYEMLTGQKPFEAQGTGSEAVMQVLRQHLQAPIPRLPNPLSPLQALLDSLLAKEPQARCQSADALLSAVNQALVTYPVTSASVSPAPAPAPAPALLEATVLMEPATMLRLEIPDPTPKAAAAAAPCLVLPGHSGDVLALAFSPDGRRALSAGRDGVIKLWDVVNGVELKTFSGHTQEVLTIAFSPDGRQALSGARGGELRLWRLT